jgi:hypothetical protein
MSDDQERLLFQVVGAAFPQGGSPDGVDPGIENPLIVTLDVELTGAVRPDILEWLERLQTLPRFAAMPGI